MGRSMYTSATEVSDTAPALATWHSVRSCYTYQSLFTFAKIPADIKRLLIHRLKFINWAFHERYGQPNDGSMGIVSLLLVNFIDQSGF
ncbi:hypothetical protein SRABI96_01156 [Peribacillus sp. Bi96]|nr:hypothetical protein SRABI96_01156 [Peribacillus sp. Bi96]